MTTTMYQRQIINHVGSFINYGRPMAAEQCNDDRRKFFTVEFTYADEATPREPQYRTVKASDENDAQEQVAMWGMVNGDRLHVGKAMTSS